MLMAFFFLLHLQSLGTISYAASTDPSICSSISIGSHAFVPTQPNEHELIPWVRSEIARQSNSPVTQLPNVRFSAKREAEMFLGSSVLSDLLYRSFIADAGPSILLDEKSKKVRFAQLIIESFKASSPFFQSEQSCAHWLVGELAFQNSRIRSFNNSHLREIKHVLLNAWAFRKLEWSREDQRIFEMIFDVRVDGFFGPEKSSAKGFALWRLPGFSSVFPKLSDARRKTIFARWLSLVLNEGYSIEEFIQGFTAWRSCAWNKPTHWLISRLDLTDLSRGLLKAPDQSTSDAFAVRVILALHLNLLPKPQEAKAWVYAELSRRGASSLTSLIGRMLWVELRVLAPQEFRFLWNALVEAQPLSVQSKYFSILREESARATSVLVAPLYLIDSLNVAMEAGPALHSEMNIFFRDTLALMAKQFLDLTPSNLLRLRNKRGVSQVEASIVNVQRRKQNLGRRLNSSSVEPYKHVIFSTFHLTSSDAVERLRQLALDLEFTLWDSNTLAEKFEPLRLQAHNHPSPELLRDLISFQAILETADTQFGLSNTHLTEAQRQTGALIDSVKGYLSIIRYPAERVALGGESEWAKSIRHRADKMLTRLEEVNKLKVSAKTKSQKDLLDQEASDLGIQLYDAFLNVDLDSVLAAKDRIVWAKILLRNLLAEGYVSNQEATLYQRHSFTNATLRSLGEFLVALEERLLAKVQGELSPLGPKLSEDVLEALVRQTSLRGLSKAVSVFGSWKQIDLSFEGESYPVVVLSEGTIQAPLADGQIELRESVPLEPVFFKALFLERIPSLSHHVVMKMRALKRPVIVLRGDTKRRLQERLKSLQGQYIEVKASQSEVILRVRNADEGVAIQANLPLPAPIEGPLGPKGLGLSVLSQHPSYAPYIAPFSAIPANSTRDEWREWIAKTKAEFPRESHWHLRSDFDVEDGDVWNAAGVFKSVPFVAIRSPNDVYVAIESVRASLKWAPLEEIFGQHPLNAGHRYKVLASASRRATYSGVLLITPTETRIELHQGTGGVVEGTDQPETWVGGLRGKLMLISLQAKQHSILAKSKSLIEIRKIADQIRLDFPPDAGGWDIEFGVEESGKIWIHQMRKAF